MKKTLFGCMVLAIAIAPLTLFGAEKAKKVEAKEVDIFKAMDDGDINVRLIPKDSALATIVVENKTDKPLNIRLPEALGGVPVMAQLGGQGGGQGGGGGGQGMGMGGGGGGGGMGGGGGGGMFNVAPDKVRKIKLPGVCLEHGKTEPNSRVEYRLCKIEEVTDSAEAVEVVKMLGYGKINQHSAQAAAWHYTDDMSWQQLAAKVGVKHLNGTVEPYFLPGNLQQAVIIAKVAEKRAEALKKTQKSMAKK